ncbi:hypothetical protein E2562_020226 [Oryza meyeriana var. granulata]|uniref:KIB1-4 beta-propeller domain-containing protein n=1 Tax=Oryza meyeriana var. granulata TaxID=110450 RepID=A0A6G1DMY5_9ORYZ|nr:hypothetical protein E2562_020226 [Oryza meyeriana var. granulata]
MPTHRRWADLQAGLVSHIAGRCTLQDYASCCAVCGAWRAALPPLTSWPLAPVLVPADGTASHEPLSLGVCSLHAQRWSPLLGLRQPSGLANPTDCRCVGARDGWVVLAAAGDASAKAGASILLFNPLTGPAKSSKVVFSPYPTARDFAAVSICPPNSLAVQRTTDGCSSTFVLDTGALMDGAVLADVAFGDDGKVVYWLTRHGAVHVLRLNRRRHRGRMRPVEIEPLVTGTDVVFPTPYDTIAQFTDAKNLVLCDGVQYQVWRRPNGAGSVQAPAGIYDQRLLRISESAVFVLMYDPRRRPCWSESKDLGGHAVFLGTNDAGAVCGDGAAVLMNGNCLYYWSSRPEGDYEAFVYNMATGMSTRLPPATGGVSSPLWYFLPAVEAASEEVNCYCL